TTIDSGPSGAVASANASFTFSATKPGSVFECGLDSAPFITCSSPASYSGLAQGSHTFQVRALDSAGNVDPTPASRTWTIDTIPPDTAITSGPPALSNSTAATFGFSATEPGSTFDCKLDAGSFTTCTSPTTYSGLAAGAHTFQVRAGDAAGNV